MSNRVGLWGVNNGSSKKKVKNNKWQNLQELGFHIDSSTEGACAVIL